MSLADAGGLFGVVIILIVYGAVALGKMDGQGAPFLFVNFAGACLILGSLLTTSFNLAATVMEGAWAVVSLAGLLRLGWLRLRK